MKILSILLSFLLILVYSFPLGTVRAVSSTDPNIQVTIASSQTQNNALLLSVTGLSGKVKSISYMITYDSGGGVKGVKANDVDVSGLDDFARDMYLGTCSQNICTPDADVQKGTVKVDFTHTDDTTNELSGEFSLDTSTTIQNQATVTNAVSSSASSGNNVASASGQKASPSIMEVIEGTHTSMPATASATATTGDAVSLTQGENSVNAMSVNAQVLNQTLNLYIPQTGNVNLVFPSRDVLSAILAGHPEDSTISAVLTSSNSFAYLTNSIQSLANTGDNSIHATGAAQIQTGNAYSIVSLLNKVNTTFIDSVVHFITINIFTNVIGNILLPEELTDGSGACCGNVVNVSDDATVTNTVTSSATSGQNSVTASGSALVVTGEAGSAVNVLNLVNQTFIDASIFDLWINAMGSWRGNFRGWNRRGSSVGPDVIGAGGTPQASDESDCPTCAGDSNLTNSATVHNTISSLANTGGNSIKGINGTVTTGKAFSAVSLINLVNTTFIRTLGWFGFVNIFGSLDGDIGGASLFPTPIPLPAEVPLGGTKEGSPTQEAEGSHTSNTTQSSVRDSGGLLTITQTNNVGAFVYPGDTVTFFIKAKNIGTGRVYNTKVDLFLIKDGVRMGGTTFAAGIIDPGKGIKITTGLVLSKTASGGTYTARAVIAGTIGPDNHTVSALADSSLVIGGFASSVEEPHPVLGASTTQGGNPLVANMQKQRKPRMEEHMKVLLVFFGASFVSIEAVKRRRQLLLALYKASCGFRLFL